MKKAIGVGVLVCCLLLVTIMGDTITVSNANQTPMVSNQPAMKDDGSKWRIGYCESESFIVYTESLGNIIRGLEELGWLEISPEFDERLKSGSSKEIWGWLSTNHEISPYLEFVESAYYNLRESESDREDVVQRLQQEQDLDTLIVMGAAAGHLLSNREHDTNIFVFAASNAVRSGIIESAEDSGKDHVWAHMDELRFERQIKAFYDMFEFETVGIVYEDSDAARVYSAIDEIEALAEDKGFAIVRKHVTEPLSAEEFPEYYQQVQEAYNRLAEQVDVMYVTIASLQGERLPELFEPFYEHKVPVFSQMGSSEVKHGALVTVSVMDAINIGRFGADTIARSLRGMKPGELVQTYQSAPQITLNVEVAKRIDFKLPFELVIVVDEAYQTIGR